jgi:acyl carrier protein
MLALENEFDIEFPDSHLTRDAFRSVRSIADVIRQLVE